jgi:hypothetical protein
MAKQVRKPMSTGAIGPKSVATDRNAIKNVDRSKTKHEPANKNNVYNPGALKPSKGR